MALSDFHLYGSLQRDRNYLGSWLSERVALCFDKTKFMTKYNQSLFRKHGKDKVYLILQDIFICITFQRCHREAEEAVVCVFVSVLVCVYVCILVCVFGSVFVCILACLFVAVFLFVLSLSLFVSLRYLTRVAKTAPRT